MFALGCFTCDQGSTGLVSGVEQKLILRLLSSSSRSDGFHAADIILGHLLRSEKTSECPFNWSPALRGFGREAARGMRRLCAREFPARPDDAEHLSVLTSADLPVCLPFGRAALHSKRSRLRGKPGVVGRVRRLLEP